MEEKRYICLSEEFQIIYVTFPTLEHRLDSLPKDKVWEREENDDREKWHTLHQPSDEGTHHQ